MSDNRTRYGSYNNLLFGNLAYLVMMLVMALLLVRNARAGDNIAVPMIFMSLFLAYIIYALWTGVFVEVFADEVTVTHTFMQNGKEETYPIGTLSHISFEPYITGYKKKRPGSITFHTLDGQKQTYKATALNKKEFNALITQLQQRIRVEEEK